MEKKQLAEHITENGAICTWRRRDLGAYNGWVLHRLRSVGWHARRQERLVHVIVGHPWQPDLELHGRAPPAPSVNVSAAGTGTTPKASITSCRRVESCPANGTAQGCPHVAGGQIIGPNGKPWIARGMDVHATNWKTASKQIPTQFPGTNPVRVAAGDWATILKHPLHHFRPGSTR